MYKEDVKNPGCLRMCPKIKKIFIEPNSFQKMSVKGMAVVGFSLVHLLIPLLILKFQNRYFHGHVQVR